MLRPLGDLQGTSPGCRVLAGSIHFDLSIGIDNDLKHEIASVKKHNEFLAEQRIKKEII